MSKLLLRPPCKNCLTYAICRGDKSIKKLIDKCHILNSYLTSRDRCLVAIKILEPQWYLDGENSDTFVQQAVSNILSHSNMMRDRRRMKRFEYDENTM